MHFWLIFPELSVHSKLCCFGTCFGSGPHGGSMRQGQLLTDGSQQTKLDRVGVPASPSVAHHNPLASSLPIVPSSPGGTRLVTALLTHEALAPSHGFSRLYKRPLTSVT